ncbi:MAG: archaetidylserine decarboxylase [Ruminobacter sp.]|nr:archaetidylserine decarboxylase [Ruminobacter sp.]MDY5779259.1 archaetidylserine decarboxylase [Succinivibrionaceae bacterium]
MIVTNLKVFIHHLTPKFLLTKLAGFFADKNLGFITTSFIKIFVRHYKIDMSEALREKVEDYKTFNEFFVRELKDGARPIVEGEDTIASPVDGTMAEFGKISYGRLIAAKGQDYSLKELLGDDKDEAQKFIDGTFACIYLAPSNYHRIHMPVTGKLRKMIFVPGKFYSVNPTYVQKIDNLFTKNERAICFFDTPCGPMAMVLVGATIVGSIITKWAGKVYPSNRKTTTTYNYNGDDQITINKGEEMGQFCLGSTVITIFGKDAVTLEESLKTGYTMKLGQKLGLINSSK